MKRPFLLHGHLLHCLVQGHLILSVPILEAEQLLYVVVQKRAGKRYIQAIVSHIPLELCQVHGPPCAKAVFLFPAPLHKFPYNILKTLPLLAQLPHIHVRYFRYLKMQLLIYLRPDQLMEFPYLAKSLIQFYSAYLNNLKWKVVH